MKASRVSRGALACIMLMAACVGSSLANASTPALSAAEWKAIQRVIADQRAALIDGNADKAFGYATEGIQRQFGDAATFMSMVRASYTALLDARYVEFLEGAVIDGLVVQPLRLIGADNTVRVALYTLEKQDNGRWRISGCTIAPSTVQAA
jgi:hypothetical protein